jgi:hypothetical protein
MRGNDVLRYVTMISGFEQATEGHDYVFVSLSPERLRLISNTSAGGNRNLSYGTGERNINQLLCLIKL